jgi:hypothetical protein
MSIHHIAMRLKYADKDWQSFLDQKYEGGHKKVRNPNQETKDHFPEVTVNHAMKDEHFRKHLEEEYEQWKGKESPEPPTIDTSKYKGFVESATSDLPNISTVLESLNQGKIDTALQYNMQIYQRDLDRAKDRTDKPLSFGDTIKTLQESVNICVSYIKEKDRMTPTQKILIEGGHAYAKNLKSKLSWKENMAYEDLVVGWTENSYTDIAMGIQQHLKEMGVKGSEIGDWDKDVIHETLTDTQKDAMLKAYAYQQEVFKKLGVTHVTLYRGVEFESLRTVPPNEGDPVQIQSRPLSSWTTNKTISVGFGSRMVKCNIPVERILMSQLTHEILGGTSADSTWNQSEYCVMGAEELDCEIIHGVYHS